MQRPSKVGMPEPGCLSDSELLAFAQGSLSESAREQAQRHVDGCRLCWSLLTEAVHAIESSTLPGEPAGAYWATTFQPGALVAQRYEVRTFVARGGMGEVYEAYDRQLHERVALKTVASTVCDNVRAVRDLKAEVALARRVTHPNVCRIYDLGTHVLRNGALLHFLTMEFVEGESLAKLIRRQGPLPLAEAEAFARALLLGLSAAHGAGILHRDFKSDNVIVRTGPDGRRTPIILDFGLARSLDERARSSDNGLAGTLEYMAPEQVEGSPLSKATDIYAFGVVWFEMLTGKLPFGGSPQVSALERLHKAPAQPSHVNPRVPKAFDAIVARCLLRAPSARFQSADAVLAAWPYVALPEPPAPKMARVAPILFVVTLLGLVAYAALRSDRSETVVQSAIQRAVASVTVAASSAQAARDDSRGAPPKPIEPPPGPQASDDARAQARGPTPASPAGVGSGRRRDIPKPIAKGSSAADTSASRSAHTPAPSASAGGAWSWPYTNPIKPTLPPSKTE